MKHSAGEGRASRIKKSRKERKRRNVPTSSGMASLWFESDGLHALVPGVPGTPAAPPSPEALDEASRLYQESIRNSPLWDEMVRQFGEKKAERLLLEFRVEVR